MKSDNTFHSAHAFWWIEAGGGLRLQNDLNDRQHTPPNWHEDFSGRWTWLYPVDGDGACWMQFGPDPIFGYVTDDGRFISIFTDSNEMTFGTAIRTSADPPR